MSEIISVKIVGDHPHRGEFGELDLDEPPGPFGMLRVVLDACSVGVEACYADRKNISQMTGKIQMTGKQAAGRHTSKTGDLLRRHMADGGPGR